MGLQRENWAINYFLFGSLACKLTYTFFSQPERIHCCVYKVSVPLANATAHLAQSTRAHLKFLGRTLACLWPREAPVAPTSGNWQLPLDVSHLNPSQEWNWPWRNIPMIVKVLNNSSLTLWGIGSSLGRLKTRSPLRKYRHIPKEPTGTQPPPGKLQVPSGGPSTLGIFPLGYCLPWVPSVRATAPHKATRAVHREASLHLCTVVAPQRRQCFCPALRELRTTTSMRLPSARNTSCIPNPRALEARVLREVAPLWSFPL